MNIKDLSILKENLKNNLLKKKLSALIDDYGDSERQKKFDFSESEIDKITDNLTDFLCEKGIAENDEPNAFGLCVESLIDKFSVD